MAILLVALAISAGQPATVTGEVTLTRAVGKPLVSIKAAHETVRLKGDLAQEVARLQSAQVEVTGIREANVLTVKAYTIVKVSGVKPMVGILMPLGNGFALKGEGGKELPLNVNPRTKERLHDKAGAKVWVHGKSLLSGELKVLRYGILRDPEQKKKEAP